MRAIETPEGKKELMSANAEHVATTRKGQWLRRRQLDGALNRVPLKFYTKVCSVCGRVSVVYLKRG